MALTHLETAERLADELVDTWQLASVRQAKGIALRGRELDDPGGALVAFEQAMNTYAQAGDAMHVNNSRYMMASTVADAGLELAEARDWAEQCAAYAQATGNQHELAHAILTRAALGASPDLQADLEQVLTRFRAVGDLRCLARCYLLQARDREPAGQIEPLQRALDVAKKSHDRDLQARTLERLVSAHWNAGQTRLAAVSFGELVGLEGSDRAAESAPPELVDNLDRWSTAVAEGRARARPPA